MDKLDVIFRGLTEPDCFILNEWMIKEGWEARSKEEVQLDPFGRMRYGVNIAAEDRNTGTFLGVASYMLPRPNYAYFALYIVHPDYRSIGIGQRLWKKVFEEIGDKNVGINSDEMTTKYRERSGFKIVGVQVLRYIIPSDKLIEKIKNQLLSDPPSLNLTFKQVITAEDKEEIVKFMQSVEKRSERYVEDDVRVGYMNLIDQHTVSAFDSYGNIVGWGTIGPYGDLRDAVSPIHAINDEIFLLILAELSEKFRRKTAVNIMITVNSLKLSANEFFRAIPEAELTPAIDQSFTKYQEYPEEYFQCFYCW